VYLVEIIRLTIKRWTQMRIYRTPDMKLTPFILEFRVWS